jgi:hypothetical protein
MVPDAHPQWPLDLIWIRPFADRNGKPRLTGSAGMGSLGTVHGPSIRARAGCRFGRSAADGGLGTGGRPRRRGRADRQWEGERQGGQNCGAAYVEPSRRTRRSSRGRGIGPSGRTIEMSPKGSCPVADPTIPFAATRSPAGDGAARDTNVKALVGVLRISDECNRETAHVSDTAPSRRSARSDPRNSDHAVSAGLLPIRPSVA